MSEPRTRYIVVIDGKPGAYGMYVPDMPGCTSMGDTIPELLSNAQEALQMWAEHVLVGGGELPEPRDLAAMGKDPDVRTALTEGAMLALAPLPSGVESRLRSDHA